ncbi:MAG: tryptophan--tRNA ligase [Clostridia bacterium]|nr:tryptophan--tRNA ligase [Clostridia bacterium]
MSEENTNIVNKKRIYSAIQPSGQLTLGNYLGALRNFPKLQNDYDCVYCIANMHSLTVRQDPEQLRERIYSLLALYLACGLDPEKNVLYLQSHVHEHAELAWILNCYTYTGELSRMTQFKDKSSKHADNINAGLFTYPVLMAADILLYQSDFVPIGQDQKQHLELSRDIADRFNRLYGKTFVIPNPLMSRQGARIMSLQDPDKKMSKSDTNASNYVLIVEDPASVMKKFKKAVTDSEAEVRYDEENKPGVSNLINIYAAVTEKTVTDVEKEFAGARYGEFKTAVGQAVVDALTPVREKYEDLMLDKAYLEKVLKEGREKASAIASVTLKDVYEKVGFVV